MHIVVSHIFSFMLDLIQFQHSSARHLYSCIFLIVLQLRVCFFFFCVNTTRVLFSHGFCSEDSHFFNRGTHSTGFSLFIFLKGTKSETRSLFSSLCVFHFIIMQKIYYIRVVFVCLLLLVSLAFSRRYKFVNKKKLKRKKNIILCVCEVVNFYFFREQRPTQNGRAGSFVIFFFALFSFSITDTLKETTSLRNGWKIVNCQSLISLSCSLYL